MYQKHHAFSLSQKLYRADQVRANEGKAAEDSRTDRFGLMLRAGKSIIAQAQILVPKLHNVLVVVGNGNNAGDGYIAAMEAIHLGYDVTLCAAEPAAQLNGDAEQAKQLFLQAGGHIQDFHEGALVGQEIIIDALLGIGLSGVLRPAFSRVVAAINESDIFTLAVDVPSGIDADNGVAIGDYVRADATLTFVGVKQGLVTGRGKQARGQLIFDDLGVGQSFANLVPTSTNRITLDALATVPPREVNAHKGKSGRLLCVGGNKGTSGAIRMTAEAAMRCGTGLVKVFTHPDNQIIISAGRPELMVTSDNLQANLAWANTIVLGPGLGSDEWAEDTFKQVIEHCQKEDKPIVIDADAINMMNKHAASFNASCCIMTPHSAEAARLLEFSLSEVDANRYRTARFIADKYNAVCILKGAGTIIDNNKQTWVCAHGNPGMATAGMGDVLSGILASMLSQRLERDHAACLGVCLHAKAGDIQAHENGQHGMLATDIIPTVRNLINCK